MGLKGEASVSAFSPASAAAIEPPAAPATFNPAFFAAALTIAIFSSETAA
jgi:hypothetical protein